MMITAKERKVSDRLEFLNFCWRSRNFYVIMWSSTFCTNGVKINSVSIPREGVICPWISVFIVGGLGFPEWNQYFWSIAFAQTFLIHIHLVTIPVVFFHSLYEVDIFSFTFSGHWISIFSLFPSHSSTQAIAFLSFLFGNYFYLAKKVIQN